MFQTLVKLVFLASCVIVGSCVATAQPKTPADIPVEAFAALPSFSGARFSADGKMMAFFTGIDGHRQVLVRPLASANGAFRIPPPRAAHFRRLRWANNHYLLVQATMTGERYDRQVTETRWFSFDLKQKKFVWLGQPETIHDELPSQLERIVDILPDDDENILLQLDLNQNGDTEVYLTNIRTGERRVRRPPIANIQTWYTDNVANVRLGTGYDGQRWVTKLKDIAGFWTDLTKADWGKNYTVAGFSGDSKKLYVTGRSPYGTKGIYMFDLASEAIDQTIFEHEHVDVNYVLENPDTGKVFAASYTDDFPRIHYFEAHWAATQAELDKALPDRVNTILREVKGKNWFFLRTENDRDTGSYYIYSTKSKRLKRVARRRPALDPALMATTRRMDIPMRDGTVIPGYLTVPQSKPLDALPTVVLPHGGPYGVRDTAAWDYEAQFYASRGYLVLKPNFRGSAGYGKAFEEAGHNQWGGLMQDDVTDATRWLIAEGYADPARICIAGASYGGYAALMGLVKEPGLYACAISVNGVTNLVKLKRKDRKYTIGGRAWTKRMGLVNTADADVSPYHHAEEINAPVLLIAAQDDARINWEMSEDMHGRLKRLKKDSRFVTLEQGTHNMVTAQSRLTMLKAAEKFLAKHIGN